MHFTTHMWKSVVNLGESILSLHYMSLKDRDGTQVLRLGSKNLYPLKLSHWSSVSYFISGIHCKS